MNYYQRSRRQGRWAQFASSDELLPLILEWSSQESALIRRRDNYGLTITEEKQLEYSREIGRALHRLHTIVNLGVGGHFNRFYENFLYNLDRYTEAGGEFPVLDGAEREIARSLHIWRVDNDISKEYEGFPITQHLFLRQSSSVLLNILGLVMLLLFFGNAITEEKERKTWLTLKTQPLSRFSYISAKFSITMLGAVVFCVFVLGIGLLIPFLRNGWSLILQYPLLLRTGENFFIISTGQYLVRNILLFLCASAIMISLFFLLSKWIDRSMNLYFTVVVGAGIGYYLTSSIKHPLNPFYFLNFNHILTSYPTYEPWVYLISAVIWTMSLLTLTNLLPDFENKIALASGKHNQFASGKTKLNKKMFSNLLVFELRKIKRDGSLKMLFIAMLIVIIAGHFLLSNLTRQRKEEYLTELDFRLSYYEEIMSGNVDWIRDLEKEIYDINAQSQGRELTPSEYNKIVSNKDLIERIKEAIAKREIQLEKLEAAIDAYPLGDWATFHEYQLYVNQRAYEMTFPNDPQIVPRVTIGRFTKLVSIHEKELLIERNIQPVFSGEFINTIHEFWGRNMRIGWRGERVRQEQWRYQNTKIDNSGLFYLYLIHKNYLYIIPLALMLLFLGGGISKEKGKKPTINLLKTQPLSEEKIYLAKVLNSIFLTTITILIFSVLVVTTGAIFNRLGDWNYPILHYNSFREMISPDYQGLAAGGHGYHFITLGKYLLNTTLLAVFVGIFVVSLANLLSAFFKKNIVILSTTILLLIGGYWLTIKNPHTIYHLSPFTYFNISSIANGEMATRLNNPSFNIITGVLLLIAISMGFVFLGYLIIKSRKFVAMSKRYSDKFKTLRDMENKSILTVKDIKKSYGKEEVLKGISFEIEKPQILALVGPNGAGKSTLLNTITNIIPSTSGEVKIFGLSNKNPEIFNDISFMQDNSILYDYLTGYDHLQFMAEVRMLSQEQVLKTAERIGISSYMHKKVGKYSLGMKQHLLLALAVLNKPRLLILDEPLNGLDPTSAIKVRDILQELYNNGTAIILSSHNLSEIDRLTNNILFIKDGNVIKEDISIYEKTGYLLTVDDAKKTQELLAENEVEVESVEGKLLVFPNKQSIHELINLLNEKGITLLDMEKRILGSEDRYKKLYEQGL